LSIWWMMLWRIGMWLPRDGAALHDRAGRCGFLVLVEVLRVTGMEPD